jgi:AbrB family looped-hinge helix DNA binding protein
MYENRHEFRIKIGEGGRMIIPAAYRKAMHIHPGDELVARLQNGELRLFQQTEALKRIRTAVKKNVFTVVKRKACVTAKREVKNHVSDFLAFRKKDSGE